MRKQLTRLSAFALAVCLLCMQTATVFAAADPTVPAADTVQSQAQETAAYILSQEDFSDLSDTSKFYHASNDLILAIRSGLNCDLQIETYLDAVKRLQNSDGTLNVPIAAYAYPNDIYMCYAYLLMMLALTEHNAADFNGADVVSAFHKILSAASPEDFKYGSNPLTYENTGMNPYYLGIVYAAVSAYSDSMENYELIKTNIQTALTALSDGNGINYYGYSADNNGMVYPHFYKLYLSDDSVKSMIDTAVAATRDTYFSVDDGTTHTIYTDFVTGNTVDEPSIDSTALALALYAQYGPADTAAMSYNALLTFRSVSTPGAFEGYDPLYASQDALIGLVTYQRALDGSTNPYDVSDALDAMKNPTDTSEPENPVSGTEETTIPDATTESPETADSSIAALWLGSTLFGGFLFIAVSRRKKLL